MNRFSRRAALPVLLVASALVASGCGKSRPQEAVLSDAAVVGSWIEAPPKAVESARRARPSAPQEFLRHVTLNADKTFVFSLRKLDGAPPKDDKKAEGTWELNTQLNVIEFTVGTNQFKSGDTGYDWVPKTMSEMARQEVAERGMSDIIHAYDQTGSSAKLVREK
jgi:hypothetical protein